MPSLNLLNTKYLLTASLLASTIVFTGCKSETAEVAVVEEVIRPVKAIQVLAGAQNSAFTYSGVVKSSKESQLSFRVSGNIKTRNVKIGSRVKKGDLLATLDQTDYRIEYQRALANQKNAEAAMLSAKASINSAESERIRTKAAYERAERLYETNSIAISEFEQARAASQAAAASARSAKLQYSSAKAQFDASKQQTISSQNQLGYTELKAPYSGVISQISIDENEQFSAGTTAMVLSADGNQEIEVGLPANVISQVKEGDAVNVSFFNIPNQTFSATVTEVGYSTNQSAVYPLIVGLNEVSSNILPGMSAEVKFELTGKDIKQNILLPATAVGEDSQGHYIYVLEKSESTETPQRYEIMRRGVVIGELDSNGFQIQEGVKAGTLVATAGLNALQQGDVVTLFVPKKN